MDAIRSLVRSWKHPRTRQHSSTSSSPGATAGKGVLREELVAAEEQTAAAPQDNGLQEDEQQQTMVWQPELPPSKYPSESWVTMTELVLPQHCDPRGYCLGGTLLAWIDVAAGIAAKKHGVYPAVTRSLDAVHFLAPITTQNIVILQASVNRAWKTSMEIGVRIVIEDIFSVEQRYCCHAYLTFVALPQPPLALALPAAKSPQLSRRTSRVDASKIIMANSPAGRRYSTSSIHRDTTNGPTPPPVALRTHTPPPSKISIQLPAIEPQTPIEHTRFSMAQRRRESRLRQSRESKAEEAKLMSEVRERMRSWGITSQAQHFGGSGGGSGGGGGSTLPSSLSLLDPVAGLLSPGAPPDQRPRVPMQATFAESTQLVLPQHANSLSITFGGQVMKWMENTCAVAASRFLRRPIVTASIDSLQFHTPSNVGDTLTIRAVVTRAFHTSVEVYCFVDGENLLTGNKTFTNEAFFSMVAIMPAPARRASHPEEDLPAVVALVPLRTAKPAPNYLPPILIPSSPVEQALFDGAENRRVHRLEQRRMLKEYEAKLHAQQNEEILSGSPKVPSGNFTTTTYSNATAPLASVEAGEDDASNTPMAASTGTDTAAAAAAGPHAQFAAQ